MNTQEKLLKWAIQLLKNKPAEWPEGLSDQWLAILGQHGLIALMDYQVHQLNIPLPTLIKEPLAAACKQHAAWEMMRNQWDQKVFEQLQKNGVNFIPLKGAYYANKLYPAPYLRPRTDTDILFKKSDLNKVIDILKKAGYQIHPLGLKTLAGQTRFTQITMSKSIHHFDHVLDLHWRTANNQQIAKILAYRLLDQTDWKYFYIHACLHFFAHSPLFVYRPWIEIPLIWYLDIYWMAQKFDNNELKELAYLCQKMGCYRVVSEVTQLVFDRFEQSNPWFYLDSMPKEKLSFHMNPIYYLWLERSGLHRLKILFPKKEHMVKKYGQFPVLALPYFYSKRIIELIIRWLRYKKEDIDK